MDQSEQSQPAEAASESQPPGDSWFEGEDSNDAPKRKTSPRAWIAGGVGAAVLAVGGIVGIHAASSSAQTTTAANGPTGFGQGQRPGGARMGGGTVGKITKVDGSALTLAAMQGGPQSSSSSASTVTVNTSDSTKVTTSSTGSISDIKVGDHVHAMGTGSTTKITAVRLVDSGTSAATSGGFGDGTPPGGGAGQGGASNMGAASGTVTSIDGSTIVVTTTGGSTVTVTASSSTSVEIQSSSSVSKLAVGDTVMVTGTTSGSTVTATAIREGALGFGGGQGGPPGGPQGSSSGQSGSGAQGGPGN